MLRPLELFQHRPGGTRKLKGQTVQTQIATTLDTLTTFIGNSQRQAIKAALRGEEREHFAQMLADLTHRINVMPKTYEQDGKGDAAIVHLHYFTSGADWFITENDINHDGEGQHQAFGLADLFHDGGELGYISIVELLRCGAELDLYWTPATLGEVKAKRARKTSTTAANEHDGNSTYCEACGCRITQGRCAHGIMPPAPTRVPSRGEEFTARLYTLLEAIRAKAEAQFAYNEGTNIPAGITQPEDSVASAIVHGVASGWNTTAKWSGDDAVELAHTVLEDANCHAEAARLLAV